MALVEDNGRSAQGAGKGTERVHVKKETGRPRRASSRDGAASGSTPPRASRAAQDVAVTTGPGVAAGAARTPRARSRGGLAFERRFTERSRDPLEQVTWERRSSIITNPDGSVVFKMEGAEVPAEWSQLATD